MMDGPFTIELKQQANYRFEVHFDNPAVPPLVTDEAAPLGGDEGPNPSRMLVTAIANCLSASLLFAMRKFKNEPGPMRTTATATIGRNAEKRLRVLSVAVDLHLGVPAVGLAMVERILAQFEEFCVVTQSVRASIPVTVRVLDATGAVLHTSR